MTMRRQRPKKTGQTHLSRRSVMAIGAIMAAMGVPVSIEAASTQGCPQAEAALLSVFRNRAAAAQVGNAALASWPRMTDRVWILAATLNDLRMDTDSVAGATVAEIATRLSQRIRDDFAAGRTVMLDGWLLSVTETRLYALAALVDG